MTNLVRKLAMGIVGIAVAISQTEAAIAQNVPAGDVSDLNVENIAKEITVRVGTTNLGSSADNTFIASGVLLRKDQKSYFVLTNKHVAKKDQEEQDYYAFIDVGDGDLNSLPTRREQLTVIDNKTENLDVALLGFGSPENYQVAILGDSSKLGPDTQIILGGYPVQLRNNRQVFGVVTLKITDIKEGSLIYSAIKLDGCNPRNNVCNAERGMSGGPLLNNEGKLIGIHRGTPDKTTEKNQGIPINTILQRFAQIASGTQIAVVPPSCDAALFGDCEAPNPTDILLPILANQNPANQPFKKLFRPPVPAGF